MGDTLSKQIFGDGQAAAAVAAEVQRQEQQREAQAAADRKLQEERRAEEQRQVEEQRRQKDALAQAERARKEQQAIEDKQVQVQRQREALLEKLLTALRNYDLKQMDEGHVIDPTQFIGANPNQLPLPSKLLIGVAGPAGAGKSALIRSCERTMRRHESKGTARLQSSGQEGTIRATRYLKEFLFHLQDSRGLNTFDDWEQQEIMDMIAGKINDREILARTPQDLKLAGDRTNREGKLENQCFAFIFVLKADDPRLMNGKYAAMMQPLRQFLKHRDIQPICALTHADLVTDPVEREELVKIACETVGSDADNTFFLYNYVDDHEQDLETDLTITQMLMAACLAGEQGVAQYLADGNAALDRINTRTRNPYQFTPSTPSHTVEPDEDNVTTTTTGLALPLLLGTEDNLTDAADLSSATEVLDPVIPGTVPSPMIVEEAVAPTMMKVEA